MSKAIEFDRVLKFFLKHSKQLETRAIGSISVLIQGRALIRARRVTETLDRCNKLYRDEGRCDQANIVFGMRCIIASHYSLLQMWIDFKANDQDSAYSALVSAQEALRLGAIVYEGFENAQKRLEGLFALQHWLFPVQTGLSVGGFVKSATCSICGKVFRTCEHRKGRMYCGQLCVREIREFELIEVSITDTPANRHCRVTTLDGVDTLTLEPRTQNDHVEKIGSDLDVLV